MGPIIEPANGKLLHALTTLGDGESWLVEPRQLDDTGKLWSPGRPRRRRRRLVLPPHRVLRPGARRHARAETLDEAIAHPERSRLRPHRRPALARRRRARASGSTPSRPATSTSTAASPARSCSASPSAAGSAPPSAPAPRPAGRTTWSASATGCRSTAHARARCTCAASSSASRELIEASQPALDYEAFERAAPLGALSDALAWAEEFGTVEGRLGPRRRAQRVPLPAAAGDRAPRRGGDAGRAAARRRGRRARGVAAHGVDRGRAAAAACARCSRPATSAVVREGDADWLARVAQGAASRPPRVRLIGGGASALAEALGGTPDVAIYVAPGHAVGPRRAAAVPARAGHLDHGPPLRQPDHDLGRRDLRSRSRWAFGPESTVTHGPH